MRPVSLRTLGNILSAALVLGGASTAWSQPAGSLDTWVETCELPDPDLVDLLDKEALVVTSGAVTPNGDASYYTLAQQPYTHTGIHPGPPPPSSELCSESVFHGQPQVNGDNFRSAVLVGPDLILTAWHHEVPTVPPVKVIFGLQYRQVGDSCIPPDFTHIPAANVYTPVEVVAWSYPLPDMTVWRLDRPVPAVPLRVRRSGEGRTGDALTMIAHPDRLATKVDLAGYLSGYVTSGGLTWPRVANMHALVGSSGSMIYNRAERFVETVTAFGVGTSFVDCGTKKKVVHVNGSFSSNSSVKHFAHNIPAFELLVKPLDTIVHVGPVGGPLSNQTYDRVIESPDTASAPIDYVIMPPELGPVPRIEITAGGPLQGTLAPGKDFKVTEEARPGHAACGVYERTYSVADETHGYTDVVRHRFEIGLREFTVDPPFGSGIVDVAPPFEDMVPFTVTNLRPTAYTVTVTANQPWLQLTSLGSDGSPLVLTLPANGAAVVNVSIDPAFKFAIGSYPATLTFTADLGGCPGTAPLTRSFNFSFGAETFRDLPPQPVPIPDGSPQGILRTINVGEEFCVGDVDVGLFAAGAPEQLVMRLISPQGRVVTLWDHGDPPDHGGLWAVFDDDGSGIPPVEPLSAIDGESGFGAWRLQVVDDVPGGGVNVLSFWDVTVVAGPCS